MGIRKLTARQEDNVRDLILKGWKYQEIADSMGIKKSLVQTIAVRKGLSRTNNRWTDRELAFLRANYKRLGLQECTLRLRATHPSMSAVCHKAKELGLT